MRKTLLSSAILLAVAAATVAAVAAAKFVLPLGKLERLGTNPILSPLGEGFEAAGVFNPAVVKTDSGFVMLYRAQDAKGTSSIGYATSADGIHFTRRAEPVLAPEAPYEKGGGVEDPRVVKIGDEYLMTYTGYNNVDGAGPHHEDAQLCLAISRDLVHWKRRGVILPAYQGKWNVGWTKSGAIVPERIHGKYWMYYLGDARGRPGEMGLATSEDLRHWTDATGQPVLERRPGKFDSRVVEPGPPPVILPEGILLIYNGADENLVYRTGWVLFDRNDPARVVARADQPIFQPQLEWEKNGQVPNVVFVEGLAREKNRWLFYYGGADKFVGVAAARPL
jgi:beta-1,2-mannosidase